MNIKKLIMPLILSLFFILPITAEIPAERQLPLLVDDAGLLSMEEYDILLAKLEDISIRGACEVAVVTVNSLDGKTAQDFADDFYDYNGYGWGPDDDGIMLVVSMADRDWQVTTYGFGISAITDYDIGVIEEKIVAKLGDGKYYDAFDAYADYCDLCIDYTRNGGSSYYESGGYFEISSQMILFSIGIGFVIALITVSVMKAQLKSVRTNDSASFYTVPGSMKITDSRDIYLYRTVKRVAKPKDEGSRGGSSTHSSSSGRSHGGGGGKF